MLANQFDVFLVDLDGVVYVGDEPLPHAKAALDRLRAMGKTLRFLTNDPRPTRAQVAERLASMGIEVALSEIVTSGSATAAYLRRTEVQTAYVIGSHGLASEVRHVRIAVVDDGQPDAVVVGCDEHVSYAHLGHATRCILRGSRFVATNADGAYPTLEGPQPVTGSIVAALRAATGLRPEIVGKPGEWMFTAALQGVDERERVVMIGDNLATDILGAHKQGLSAILVGERPQQLASRADYRTPEATIRNLAELFSPGVRAQTWQLPPFAWPDHIAVGVSAFVFDAAERILLVRRADNGLWAIPSGRVEPGETVAEAIVRELLEETGARVQIQHLIGVYSDPVYENFTFPTGETWHMVFITFRCRHVGGEIRADGIETLDVAFFDPDELPHDRIPMHPCWLTDARSSAQRAFIR